MTEEHRGSGRVEDAGDVAFAHDRSSIREVVDRVLREVSSAFVGRDDAARSLLWGALSGRCVALIGPPGTAKTALVHAVLSRIDAPLVRAAIDPVAGVFIANDAVDRVIEGPHFAFVEDALDAQGSALAEVRAWVEQAPSRCVIATALSSESVEPALLDRFIVRVVVAPLDEPQFAALLSQRAASKPAEHRVSFEILQAIRDGAARVTLDPAAQSALVSTRAALLERGVVRSDRWWLEAVSTLKVAVFVDGRDQVELDDLPLLSALFATETEDARDEVVRWLSAVIHEQTVAIAVRIGQALSALEDAVEQDHSARAQARDAQGRPLFRRPDGGVTTERALRVERRSASGERLFARPKDLLRAGAQEVCTARELYEQYFLGRVSALKAYTEDDRNALWEERENTPVTEPRVFDEAHVDRRIEWLATIALDLRDARSMCTRSADSARRSIWSGAQQSAGRQAAAGDALLFEAMVPRVSALRAKIASLPVSVR